MTYIIAEAGTGHFDQRGLDRRAKALDFIRAAARAGANAVKFQMFVRDEPLFCQMPGDEARTERWNNTFIRLEHWRQLQEDANKCGIDLLWSAFQPTCVEWLKELKPRYVKVASRACGNFPYSTMPPDTEFIISGSYAAVIPEGFFAPENTFPVPDGKDWRLKCVRAYPAPLEQCGFDEAFDGLSDHSGTIWPGLDAIYHGAKFLEVHFKIPGADMGNDEPVCLTVDQLKLLCEARDAYARMHP